MGTSTKTSEAKLATACAALLLAQVRIWRFAASQPADSGTCCLDIALVRLRRFPNALLQKTAELTGIRLTPFHWGQQLWYRPEFQGVPGMAGARTRAVELAVGAVREFPCDWLEASVFYQMD
jgi:hypothetical protein